MISFIHTGDLHLGLQFKSMKLDSSKRRLELWDTFERIVNTAIEKKVDFLFIAGDLFEESYFTYKDIKRVHNILSKAEDVKILIVAGNHDTLNRNSLYNLVQWPENVTLFSSVGIEKKEFEDKNTVVYGYSWDSGENDKDLFKDFEGIDITKTNILIIHGDAISKDTKYLPLDIYRIQRLGFDYIALGHIHKPEIISDRAAYCGSPEPLDFGETGQHGIIMGTIDNKNTSIEFVPFSRRIFLDITVNLDESMGYMDILDRIKNCDNEDRLKKNFYRITLQGKISPEVELVTTDIVKALSNEFYYLEIIDKTQIDYDLDALESENRDNIIGCFIREMRTRDLNDEINRQALYLGLDVLMKGKVGL